MKNIPTVDSAGVIAAKLCSHLPERDQAMFIAGFQESIKYLNTLEVECIDCNWIGKKSELITIPDYKPGHFIEDLCPVCKSIVEEL